MFSEDTFQQDLEKAFATINGEFQFTLIVVGDAKPVQRALRRVRWKRFFSEATLRTTRLYRFS